MKAILAIVTVAFVAACTDAPAADGRAGAGTADVPASVRHGAVRAAADPAPTGALRPIALRVPDMACRLCARPIEHRLSELGVQDVKADLETKWVTGRFDPGQLSPDAIRNAVEDLRFRVAELRIG